MAKRGSGGWRGAAQGCLLGGLGFGILAAAGAIALLLLGRPALTLPATGAPLPTAVAGDFAAQSATTKSAPEKAAATKSALAKAALSQAAPSRTPFRPRSDTPVPSFTPTASATVTVTASLPPSSTVTPFPTNTPIPTATPTPTETPLPPTATPADGLPESAWIAGVSGYAQALPLSCEARSAVDWARFFGTNIRELAFQNALPRTDNPNTGFVGDPREARGGIPPAAYGAHPPPVARLLTSYGVRAASRSGMTWKEARSEIAAGRPVIAWVIGNVWTGTQASAYTAADGETLLVAPFEHTVILTAYSPSQVTVLDNDMQYSVPVEVFLESWGVLGNLAVVKE